MAGIIFLAPLLTFLLPSVRPVASIRRPRFVPTLAPSDKPLYFFTSHHKTGTALMNHLCDHVMGTVEGGERRCARCGFLLNASDEWAKCWYYWTDGVNKTRSIQYYNLSTRFFTGTPLSQVVRAGGNYLATHIIRDPLTTFASGYIYDQKGGDNNGAGKDQLQGLSLKEGLKLKALDVKRWTQEVLEAHRMAVERPGTILEVKFEDFRADYNASAARLFRFVAGGGRDGLAEALTPAFLARAAKDDQMRWQPVVLRMNLTHYSEPEDLKRVVAALRELCAEGNQAVAEALAPREEMGYGEKCPGPLPEAS